jgi:hypothetical protein
MTRTKLPPGIIYLTHRIPQLLIGPISTYLLIKLYQTFYGTFQLSSWVTIILLILSGPVIFAISLAWNDFKNYRGARAIGAVLPPRISDYSPGNIYSIWKEIKHENTGYFGEIFSSFFADRVLTKWFLFILGDGFKDQAENSGGFSFNLRFLFQNRVSPSPGPKYNASSLNASSRWSRQNLNTSRFLKTLFYNILIYKDLHIYH